MISSYWTDYVLLLRRRLAEAQARERALVARLRVCQAKRQAWRARWGRCPDVYAWRRRLDR